MSRQSGTRDTHAIKTIREIIDWANNTVGDGGDLDIEGTGYLQANDFASATHDSNGIKLAHDNDEIKMNVDNADNNYIVLSQALNGWEPPTSPEGWKSSTHLEKTNELLLAAVNNPGVWDNFMFQPKFIGRYNTGPYNHHITPT
jgi:hypothetical protein